MTEKQARRAAMTPNFGTGLRDARKQLGISQEQLADRSGLHRTHVSLIERGQREPSLDTLAKLSRGLQIPPATMILWHEPRGRSAP
jgi:transcriptional regulator with XRE-family HTH domain